MCHKEGLKKFNKLGLHIHESNFSEPRTSLVHNYQTEISLVQFPLWQRHQCRGHPYVCLLNQENERLLRYRDGANRKYYYWRLHQAHFFKKMFSHFCPFFLFGFSIIVLSSVPSNYYDKEILKSALYRITVLIARYFFVCLISNISLESQS